MTRKGLDIEPIRRAIVKLLEAEESIAAAYLFGSFGTRAFGPESDIDIGILFRSSSEYPSADSRIDLKDRLEKAAGREVDLVVLNSVSPILAVQVLRHGRKIFEKDRRAAEEFFVRTVESYADLKMTRREIEARVLQGSIYG